MRLSICFVLILGVGIAVAQSCEEPPLPVPSMTTQDTLVREPVADPAEVLTLIEGASESVYLYTPALTSPTLQEVVGAAAARGVLVCVILGQDDSAAQLIAQGIEVKSQDALAEGLLMVDTRTLVHGGLLSGSEQETVKLNLSAYVGLAVEQVRALWQVAEPYER